MTTNRKSLRVLKHQKVKSTSKRSYKTALSLFVVVTIFISILIFFVWSRLQITHLGYQLSQANSTQQKLLKLNKQMKLEVASLKSLARIENIAKNQLGLINPEPHQVVFIK